MNKTLRRIIIWALLVIVCIPNILLAELPIKIFGAMLGALLISWDAIASKRLKPGKQKTPKLKSQTPKQDKYAVLEAKPVWRLLKVLYAVLCVIAVVGFISAMSTEVAGCRDESTVQGTRMIRAAIQRNIDNGTVCNVGSTQIGAVMLGVVVLAGLWVGYLLFRRVTHYIVIGKVTKSIVG